MKARRILGIVLACLLIAWSALIYVFAGIFNLGTKTLLAVAFVLLLKEILHRPIEWLKNKLIRSKPGRALVYSIRGVIVLIVLLVLTESNLMLFATLNKAEGSSTLVVLGSQVKSDGPSLMTIKRLEAAYDYLIKNPDSVAVLSGGQGENEPWSEAKGMADYLILRGIESKRLYLEDKSTSTRENLIFSMELIKAEGLDDNISIVTNAFHIYRAGRIAKRAGIKYYVLPAKSVYGILPSYYIRELYAILADWFIYS